MKNRVWNPHPLSPHVLLFPISSVPVSERMKGQCAVWTFPPPPLPQPYFKHHKRWQYNVYCAVSGRSRTSDTPRKSLWQFHSTSGWTATGTHVWSRPRHMCDTQISWSQSWDFTYEVQEWTSGNEPPLPHMCLALRIVKGFCVLHPIYLDSLDFRSVSAWC